MSKKDEALKPVAWIEHGSDEVPSIVVWERGDAGHYTPLYEHPPASKPWVGLDDTDLAVCDTDGVRLARYWERVLREKNA